MRPLLRTAFEDEQREAERAGDLAPSIGPDGLALAASDGFLRDALES